MSDIKPYKENSGAVAARPVNIDGKGLNGFLLDWYRSEPRGVVAKPQRQVLAEFFTSMLVLSAQFKYKPSIGTANYLYLDGNAWLLSLIAPQQWSEERRAGFVGTCILQKDMTWTIEPSDNLKQAGPVTDAVGRFYDAFADTLDTNLTLEEILPFYVGRMPYYQRLYANALSRSIRAAVTLGDQRDICSRDWRQILPRREFMLLSGANR
jgi:prepilin-type processing-associated H-X9-DG protein